MSLVSCQSCSPLSSRQLALAWGEGTNTSSLVSHSLRPNSYSSGLTSLCSRSTYTWHLHSGRIQWPLNNVQWMAFYQLNLFLKPKSSQVHRGLRRNDQPITFLLVSKWHGDSFSVSFFLWNTNPVLVGATRFLASHSPCSSQRATCIRQTTTDRWSSRSTNTLLLFMLVFSVQH